MEIVLYSKFRFLKIAGSEFLDEDLQTNGILGAFDICTDLGVSGNYRTAYKSHCMILVP